ncbi:NACHT domain-containing protein [Actinokineospora inagensis]|uniref:NACHT domain-containing protein n=1 Tax=Actinokineospora inagensis TaxID=103730 RepID=UPI0003FB1E93|nr:NACHT domain-containing protein [Actinokineospora inagensis]
MGKRLVVFLVAVLPPAGAVVLSVRQPQASLLFIGLTLVIELAVVLVSFGGKVTQDLLARWRGRAVEYIDAALARRFSRFHHRYRAALRDSLRDVDLSGLVTTGYYTPGLDELFVDLQVEPRAPTLVDSGVLDEAEGPRRELFSVEELVGRRDAVALAVLGVPGSGKTTLLRHLARQTAREGRRGRRDVPILLYLRDHVDSIVNERLSLSTLVTQWWGRTKHREPVGWFEQRLDEGRCLVLLDGLDEIADRAHRRAVANWITAQVESHYGNDFVITSRPRAYETEPVGGATVYRVHSLTEEKVERFVRAWYGAFARDEDRRAKDRRTRQTAARARDQAGDLLDRVRGDPGLRALAVNPLLLTMIVNVHQVRGTLPKARVDLYREICEVLLWRRDERSGAVAEQDRGQVRDLLAALAHDMMLGKTRKLPRSAVVARITGLFADADVETVLDRVRRTGLFVDREETTWSFAHLTIQEYLAAAHVSTAGSGMSQVKAIDDPWWRETILFHVADPRAGADLGAIVRSCLRSGTEDALSLAFDVERHGRDIGPEVRAELDALVESSDPTRRRLVARVLLGGLLREVVTRADGAQVCVRPVTARIYALHLRDRALSDPTVPAGTGADDPVVGVRAETAGAFVLWANEVMAGHGPYRLPRRPEIEESPATRLAVGGNSVWLAPGDQRLWVPKGVPHPHLVDRASLVAHVRADIERSGRGLTRLLLTRALVITGFVCGLLAEPDGDRGDDDLHDHLYDLDRTLCHARDHGLVDQDLRITPGAGLATTREQVGRLRAELTRLAEPRDPHDPNADFDTAHDQVMGRTLSQALVWVLNQNAPADTWLDSFTTAFLRYSGVTDARDHIVPPGSPLPVEVPSSASPWALRTTEEVRVAITPFAAREKVLTRQTATDLRLRVLCLAGEADGPSGRAALIQTAAGLTLLERRDSGETPPTETIILAAG